MRPSEWEDEFSRLPIEQQASIVSALHVLRAWPTFREQYDPYGFGQLQVFLSAEYEMNKTIEIRRRGDDG